MNTKSTDPNKLPAEVLSAMDVAFLCAGGVFANAAMQAAYDASPGPALEAENARLREALEHLYWWINDRVEPGTYSALSQMERIQKALGHKPTRTAIARAMGE